MDSINFPESEYRREYIEEIQRMLRRIGTVTYESMLKVPITGVWSEADRMAVSRFQQINGLPESGEVDAQTFEKLKDEYAAANEKSAPTAPIHPYPEKDGYALSKGEKGELVLIAQLMLDALNLNYDLPYVPLNGVFGEDMEESIKTLQGIFMLPQSGIVDRATWKLMAEAYNRTVNGI